MRILRSLAIVLVTLAFTSFSYADELCKSIEKSVAHYSNTDPVHEAKTAAQSGNLNFLGIYGYSISTPGIDGTALDCWKKILPVKGIEGTSDFLVCDSQENLLAVGNFYATKYNAEIVKIAIQLGKRCEP